MRILWTEAAATDLESLEEYIRQDNPEAAIRQVLRIVDTVERSLLKMPGMGRIGRIPGTRELVISGTPYIVPYRVQHNSVQILRVLHAARKWPSKL